MTRARRTILVVEDEADIRELACFHLRREGFNVLTAASGEEALETVRRARPDLIVLDIMLPAMSGLDVCRAIRQDRLISGIPIIMATARGEDADIVAGLELGADDYVAKPFSMSVLAARVRAVLRRREKAVVDEKAVLSIHGLVIDPLRHQVTVRGEAVALTPLEFRILHTLAANPGMVFTREQIVEAVRGGPYAVTDRSVDVQIVGIRRKLGRYANLVETVRGVGYRFKETE